MSCWASAARARAPRRRARAARRAGRDDASGVGAQRRLRVEALDLARLHGRRLSTSLSRRRRSFCNRFSVEDTAPVPRWPRPAPRAGSRSAPPARPGRLPAPLRAKPVEELDLDVAVAPLAERVGQRLHPLQRLAVALARKAGLRRPPAPPAAAASPPACRARARSSSMSSTPSECSKTSVGPHLDHPRRGQRERLLAIEARHLASARHALRLAGVSRHGDRRAVALGGEARPARSR